MSSFHGYKRSSWFGRPINALLRGSMAGKPQLSPSHDSHLPPIQLLQFCSLPNVVYWDLILPEVSCEVRRFFCSSWNKSTSSFPSPSPHFFVWRQIQSYRVNSRGIHLSLLLWEEVSELPLFLSTLERNIGSSMWAYGVSHFHICIGGLFLHRSL